MEATGTSPLPTDHGPGSSFEEGGQWHTPCGCGRRFAAATPTGSQQHQRKHAEEEGKKSVRRTAAPVARAKECGCGCGQPLPPRAGGLFRSGHDARFKSMLTQAHATGSQILHPLTRETAVAMDIAVWLDERRGAGTFWQDKVRAGHKPVLERKPRPPKKVVESAAGEQGDARAERVMQMIANRRAVPGDTGTVDLTQHESGDTGMVTLRSGSRYGARVVRRENDDAIQVVFLDGPSRGEKVIVGDHRFKKAKK